MCYKCNNVFQICPSHNSSFLKHVLNWMLIIKYMLKMLDTYWIEICVGVFLDIDDDY